jgi:hypothetical protein
MSWLKQKLRMPLFKAWQWTYDHDEDEGLVYYAMNGERRVCPGVGCDDGECPHWG